MKPFVKKLLWVLLIPLGIALLMMISGEEGMIGAGLMLMAVAAGYVVVGVIMLIVSKESEEMAKALLLSAGIILLVGLSTCGLILSNLGGMH